MNRLLIVFIFLLAGCKQELYSSLTEKEANQIQALLLSSNIDVKKEKNKKGYFFISVDESDFVKSMHILDINGIPKRKYAKADEIFPAGQLVVSPLQEKARLTFLKEQNIESLMTTIPGVLDCNVVLTLSDKKEPSSVSVIIIASPQSNIRALNVQLRELIKNSIGDISTQNISIVIRQYDQYQL